MKYCFYLQASESRRLRRAKENINCNVPDADLLFKFILSCGTGATKD